MRLAIAVTYIVHEDHGALLDLHLARIARHTSVPWTIYGSVTRLHPRFRDVLERVPGARLFELPATEARGTAEHASYLEVLIARAIDDGATHVAILHVDSFPVVDGWAERLAGTIRDDVVFATADCVTTACLLFPREFYLEHRPRLLGPAEGEEGEDWKRYLREVRPVQHSGIGYGFAAHRAGLRWYAMQQPRTKDRAAGPRLFDEMIVHVEGALRLSDYKAPAGPLLQRVGHRPAALLADTGRTLIQRARRLTPAWLRPVVRRLVPRTVDERLFDPQRRIQGSAMAADLERLLADPDAFLGSLGSGR